MFHLTQNREFQIKTTLRYNCFYVSDWQNKKVKATFEKLVMSDYLQPHGLN